MRGKILLAAAAILLSAQALAAKEPVFSTAEGAIRGYDPVAYFSEGKPVKGSRDISLSWKGATWYFSSRENLEKFSSSPETYAPAYGGYCAYAVANGYTATTDPDAWSIVGDRLFLNYSLGVKRRWEKNISGYIKNADANWPGVLAK